jgi:parvulin-like peptidyl-prolyl isomerase
MTFLQALPAILALQVPLTVPAPPSGDKPVITVNGHAILARDVAPYLWDWKASEVGQQLIVKELVEQEAAKRSVKITDAEINERVQQATAQLAARMPKGMNLEDFLKQQGYPGSLIVLQCRVGMLLEKLTQLDFKLDDYVMVSTIIIQPKDQTTTSLSTALKAANDASTALQKGDNWDKVVLQYASDQRAASNHGELGWRPVSEFPPEISKDIRTIKDNGYTQPVQTANGFQIFRVERHGAEATAGEMTELKGRYQTLLERSLLERLRKEAKITTAYGP